VITSDFKSAARSILRNKVTSIISILGLGIGLGCIIVLTALIIHEKSFDSFVPEYRNVYRIIFGSSANTPYPLPEVMAGEFPEVKDFFRYYQANTIQLKNSKNETVEDRNFGFADPSIFRIMRVIFLSGNPASSVGEIAISDESALKYFGSLSPIGAILPVRFADGFAKLSVSGVYKSFPANSTLNPYFIADIKLSEKIFMQFQKSLGAYGNEGISSFDWRYPEFMSYLVLDRNSDAKELSDRMGKYKQLITAENKDKIQYSLQPVKEIYLRSGGISANQWLRQGNPEELKYYEAIAFLILLISIANFILLARAGVSERVHELGTRKVFGASRGMLRRLIITIFMILIAGVIAVTKQIKYSMSGYKGINPENILVTDLNTAELKNSFSFICDEMKKIPGVESVAGGSFIPPFGNFLPINLAVAGGDKVRFDGLIMGEGMTELLGLEIIDGSSFGPYKPGIPEILINESSALKYKIKAGENILVFKVRGIVRDFNAHSLHTLIQPMVILQQDPSKMGLIAIKANGKNDDQIKIRLHELYNQISPDEIFEVSYLTDQLDLFYSRENNQLKIIVAFSLLAAILSVMGLFGVSLISISKRTREIGIRKVNGASITEVLFMLNTEFIKWVLVSVVIAIPTSVWLISLWMKRFAYKTELSWWIFAVAGFTAIIIAVITVSWQSSRAATRNPVEALRYE
jgi:ABC-type antimicrobial peptide transport system permease subunit